MLFLFGHDSFKNLSTSKKSLKTYQLRQALPHLLPLILYSGYFLCYNETGQNKKVKNTEMTKKPQYHRKLQKHITNNTKI